MQLTKLKVKDLYGMHHYEISFDEHACIKIIHAPNGYGKTTLLKLIEHIIYYRLVEISSIPFDAFYIEFDEDLAIEVVKKPQREMDSLMYYNVYQNGSNKTYEVDALITMQLKALNALIPNQILAENRQLLRQILAASYTPTKSNDYYIEAELEKTLKYIQTQMPIHLIHANRLVQPEKSYKSYYRKREVNASVLVYAKELAYKMKAVLTEASKLSQQLDRSFPKRLIKSMQDTKFVALTKVQIKQELKDLEKERHALESVGLLLPGGMDDLIEEELDEIACKVLTIYISDSKKKLEIFKPIAVKLQVMQKIINKRFAYKTMHINEKEGFVFEMPFGECLSADKLSSGEQNELILIFELLFKSQVNALILIDEPEISLHIAWQQSFLEDMEVIAALTGVKLVIATHSPDIINGRWNLTTGLEEC